MGLVQTRNAELNKLTALVLVLSCVTSVLGDVINTVSWTQPPHHAPIYPPVGAPRHHKGGHHKGGGHHKAPAHPPVKPPVHAPVKPPVHAPVKPPVHAPVKPPVHAPVKPPVHAPVKPPVHAPVKPPVHAPVKPPVHAPVKPPVHSPTSPPRAKPPTSYPVPTRKLVAVQGVVFCKPCKYFGVDTLLGATPVLGAIVKLECKNTKYKPLVVQGKTDKNGYFYIKAPKTITTYASHKCKVYLVSSPLSKCKKLTNLHYGIKGATLMPSKPTIPPPPPSLQVFTVGPFAFEPYTKLPCHR